MFENIIGQDSTVAILRQELASGTLPRALLLHGPQYGGKLSTALEIARVLTCSRTGDWSCGCPSCRRQRLLTHPGTVLAGSRYFEQEIAAAADVLARTRKAPAQYLFIRAVRKLTRRFDPMLWEGEESRVRGQEATLAQVEEALDSLSPEAPDGGELAEKGLEKRLQAVQAGCRLLARALPADNIPVNVVRRATAWMHLTPGVGEARKVLILETAERMVEASANSLLKVLEEPPQDARLILITAHRAGLIPTVVSRLRPYAFAERGPEQNAEVLARVFREESGSYSSLRDYFLHWEAVNPEALRLLARRFVQSLAAPTEAGEGGGPPGALEEAVELVTPKTGRENDREIVRRIARIFFEELSDSLRQLLRADAVEARRLRLWNDAFSRHLEAFEVYNQQPAMSIESLYYCMRGIE
jgi:DNA polymerase III delta prime subunit